MAAVRKILGALLAVALLALLVGCGKRGALVPPESLIPAPVGDLAVAQKGGHFLVSWSAPSRQEGGAKLRDLAGFLLFRRTLLPPAEDCEECPGAYSQLARMELDYPQSVRRSGNGFLFEDFETKEGRGYQYKVRSFTTEGAQSRDSNKVRRHAFPPLPPPVLEALSSAEGVVLAFVALPPDEGTIVGYNIYRSPKGSPLPPALLNTTPVAGKTYADSKLLLGTSYSYTVTSVAQILGETVESAPSNTAEGAMLERD